MTITAWNQNFAVGQDFKMKNGDGTTVIKVSNDIDDKDTTKYDDMVRMTLWSNMIENNNIYQN